MEKVCLLRSCWWAWCIDCKMCTILNNCGISAIAFERGLSDMEISRPSNMNRVHGAS